MANHIFFKKTLIFLSIFFNLLIIIICFTPLTDNLYKPLIVNETPQKSDVIIILAAGANREGYLGFRSLNRIERGVQLYREGLADKIICAGGDWYEKANKSIADIMKEKLLLYNIPDEAVIVQAVPPHKMRPLKSLTINTYTDMEYWLSSNSNNIRRNRTIVVTSSYHTYRTRKILDNLDIDASVVCASPHDLLSMKWSQKLDIFREEIREYLAIIYFRIKGYL